MVALHIWILVYVCMCVYVCVEGVTTLTETRTYLLPVHMMLFPSDDPAVGHVMPLQIVHKAGSVSRDEII